MNSYKYGLWKRFFKMDFLTNLDFLLKSHNMKRADLARAIGIAPSTINSWYARGSEKINIKVLKAIIITIIASAFFYMV